ncbi:MAG: ABC transporter permease [Chloroflexota bacterium]
MVRLFWRKLGLILILLPILNVVGFYYALVHPRLFTSGQITPTEALNNSYSDYLSSVFRGEFGFAGQQTVRAIVMEPLQNSLILVVISLVLAIILGILFGLIAISPRTRRISPFSLAFLSAGSSLPGFLFGGIILSLIVYQTLYAGRGSSILPISGYGLDEHLILHVLVLAIQPTMYIAKVTAGLLENELQQNYIQVARSKGLNWRQLLWRHAFPNMLAPVLLTIGSSMRLIVGALVIVEAIFIWPGIGRIFLLTIGLRLDGRPTGIYFGNPPLIAFMAVFLGAMLLFADLIATMISSAVDPRLREQGVSG